jgi:lipooligosaccharide transport system permease protein
VTAPAGVGEVVRDYVPRAFPLPHRSRQFVHVLERQVRVYRRYWMIFLAGFVEPLLFLGSIGVGVGRLVHTLPGPAGTPVDYAIYVAPGLLATSAMNGAVMDTTFGFFVNYKYGHTYDAMLATPMRVLDVAVGEVTWALLRGAAYSSVFLATMAALGYVESPWALLAAPVAVLIGMAFASAGLAATTWMRSFVDFDFVNLALVPLFLFSGVFFPIARYPDWLETVVRLTPLYQGVELERRLVLGALDPVMLLHAAYLAAMAVVGIAVASRRLRRLLQP